jgi:hypothetical protein
LHRHGNGHGDDRGRQHGYGGETTMTGHIRVLRFHRSTIAG